MAAYGAPWKAVFIVLLTPCWGSNWYPPWPMQKFTLENGFTLHLVGVGDKRISTEWTCCWCPFLSFISTDQQQKS